MPQQVLCDNAKALIIERDAYAEGEHKLHVEMLLQMSKDYGFKLSACKPYRAKTKGKIERFNHYLKNSFIIPLNTAVNDHRKLIHFLAKYDQSNTSFAISKKEV